MRLACATLAAACCLAAAQPEPAALKRGAIVEVEQEFDGRIKKLPTGDPMEVLNSTQGVYLAGYGAVFTAQLDLIVTPTLNPFRQKMAPADVARVRQRKEKQLPVLKQNMREMLMATARSLETMPPKEQIVLAVSLFYSWWENKDGLPSQIVMRAERQQLLNRTGTAIQVEEQ